ALEALVDQHVLAGRVGKADRRGLRALRERWLRDERGYQERERQFHRRLYVAQCPAMKRMLFLTLLLPFCAAAAANRIDQARREGEVVWYTAMNVPDAEAVRTPFVRRYPFPNLPLLPT